ncbi:hypothetical protein [Luteimonas arsenica]|uniref:hypothetical protein n=1 Tax=Luteimonas arsenica TaxID=1586242 RepID=UPI001054AEC9|nr:hypothetical protein [Luteimonas arsenica]
MIALAFALCVGIGLAWCVHMAGALVAPRGPEQRAVVRAGDAVMAYVQAIGTPRQDAARHQAAQALYRPGPLWSPTSPWTHGRADA